MRKRVVLFQKGVVPVETSKLYPVLLTLLDICEENKDQVDQAYYSPIAFAKEFCTIQLQACRRAGHTSAMIKLVENNFNKSLLILMNQDQCHIIKKWLKQDGVSDEKYEIHSSGGGEPTSLRGLNLRQFDAIIFDCAYVLKNRYKELVYSFAASCCDNKTMPYFIFLG